MTNFSLNISAFAEKAKLGVVLVQRKVAFDLLTELHLRSPVDTGRYISNHQVGLGVADLNIDDPPDPTGAKALADGAAIIARAPGDVDIVLSQNLPYAKPIEEGHSQKAPAGVYAVAAAKFRAAFGDAVDEVRGSR